MSKEYYVKTAEYINSRPKLKSAVIFAEKYSPKAIEIIFFGILIFLLIKLDIRIIPAGAIPLFTFVTVTLLGRKLNFKRPFEELGFESVTPHSKGHSCPSRHAASACIITMAALYINTAVGLLSLCFAVIVCISRVVTGVHYIRDVLCGIALSFTIGYIGFFVIL